jgi:hypothetical protein
VGTKGAPHLVIRELLGDVRIFTLHARPEDGRALARRHRDVELGEARLPALRGWEEWGAWG